MHNLFHTNPFKLLLIKNGAHENQLIMIPPVDKMATYLGPYMGMRRSMEDYMGMGDYMGNGWTTISGKGDYMDMEKVYGEGWLGYYETW